MYSRNVFTDHKTTKATDYHSSFFPIIILIRTASTMSRFSDFFPFQNKISLTARRIMPYLVNMRSFIRFRCKLMKIWDPILPRFAKKCMLEVRR